LPATNVQEIVAAAWSEFTDRPIRWPIRDIVPVLAERAARDSLS